MVRDLQKLENDYIIKEIQPVDMFPYKTTELFQELGFYSQLPKKPGNATLSGTYFSFLDINTTVSTCLVCGNISNG